jgi:hypothetical protein
MGWEVEREIKIIFFLTSLPFYDLMYMWLGEKTK